MIQLNVDFQVAFEQKLLAACTALARSCGEITRWTVAFSGGWDSSALLHGLLRTQAEGAPTLRAIHVDHGLHPESQRWAEQCRAMCEVHGVEFQLQTLTALPSRGESVEAWAREQRYSALAGQLLATEILFTAHHRDDQAETFLLNALRGAGPEGLRGIAQKRRLGAGWLGRPCLPFAGEELRRYSRALGLACLEDPSNLSASFDRNYLRHQVFPLINARWPGAGRAMVRAATLQHTAAEALGARADQYLAETPFQTSDALEIVTFTSLPATWQGLCLRRWITARGHSAPTAAQLERVIQCVLGARDDRNPRVEWQRSGIRRYRNELFLYHRRADVVRDDSMPWDLATPLVLPGGVLSAVAQQGGIRAAALVNEQITVRPRRGGERCRPAGRTHSQTLKRLLQERHIPPWQRAALPLVYVGDELAAVGDLWVCADFAARPEEAGWALVWSPTAPT